MVVIVSKVTSGELIQHCIQLAYFGIETKISGITYYLFDIINMPYTTRYTFAAWCLTLKMDPNKLVNLMGHSSKKMVYEVYGRYVEGLETDAGKISSYFGNDFNALDNNKALPFT